MLLCHSGAVVLHLLLALPLITSPAAGATPASSSIQDTICSSSTPSLSDLFALPEVCRLDDATLHIPPTARSDSALPPSPAAAAPATTDLLEAEAEIASEAPLLALAPAVTPPELLSFHEWKEKYVAEPETLVAKGAGGRKGSTRRADERGDSSTKEDGMNGTSDGSDGLNERDEDSGFEVAVNRAEGEDRTERETNQGNGGGEGAKAATNAGQSSSVALIQPLANVGSGDRELDPLVKLKDRSNYALFDCSAQVHRSSPQSKGASSILVEKKDRYMLTPCQADKFVEVELCDEIRIDTVVLANFEYFSSMFKHFSIKVSMHYPGRADEWHDLGTFRARNVRGVQVFHPIPLPGWYRYMRIDFLSHYGSEYYCPVSLLRVYGATQLEAYRLDAERDAKREAELASLALSAEDEEEDLLQEEGITAEKEVEQSSSSSSVEELNETVGSTIASESTTAQAFTSSGLPSSDVVHIASPSSDATKDAAAATIEVEPPSQYSDDRPPPSPHPSATVSDLPLPDSSSAPLASSIDYVAPSPAPTPSSKCETPSPPSIVLESSSANLEPSSSSAGSPTEIVGSTVTRELTPDNSAESIGPAGESDASPRVIPPSSSQTSTPPPISTSRSSTANEAAVASARSSTMTTATSRNDSRPITTLIPVPQAQPGDSIYGTIMKRLASLEQSSNLAIQYMDAQNSMLRDLLTSLDRRLGDVEGNRQSNDKTIHLTLTGLERDRSKLESEREIFMLKLSALEEEMRVERRLGIAQMLCLLAVFCFIALTRGSPTLPLFNFTPKPRSSNANHDLRIEELKTDPRRKTPRGPAGLPNRRLSAAVARTTPRSRFAQNRINTTPASIRHSASISVGRPSPIRIINNEFADPFALAMKQTTTPTRTTPLLGLNLTIDTSLIGPLSPALPDVNSAATPQPKELQQSTSTKENDNLFSYSPMQASPIVFFEASGRYKNASSASLPITATSPLMPPSSPPSPIVSFRPIISPLSIPVPIPTHSAVMGSSAPYSATS